MGDLTQEVYAFWFNDLPGFFHLDGQEISRAKIQLHGGPAYELDSCPSCQRTEWLSRIRQENLYTGCDCSVSGICKTRCEWWGDDLWTNYHPDHGRVVAWDQSLLAFFLERMSLYENPLILDIGANTGSFCLLAKLHPGARIIAFEPSPAPFRILQNNIKLNRLSDRVEARNCTLAGPLDQLAVTEVDSQRLDDLELPHVDLIRLDEKGRELFVLRNGEKLIRRDKPELVLKYVGEATQQYGYHTSAMIELLKGWGYSYFGGVGVENLWARHLGEGLTMFATLKPFVGEAAVIQRNALKNWVSLDPRPEIIIFGDEEGVAEICAELHLIHVPEISRSESGMPLLDAMFREAEARASFDVLVWCDGDVLFSGLTEAARVVSATYSEFLLVALRRNIDVGGHEIDFGPSWAVQFADAPFHPPCAEDFFMFTKGFYPEVPPLAIASYAMDNWLVENALGRGRLVIDASPVVAPYHQAHAPVERKGPDWERNLELFGGDPSIPRGFVTHAPWILDENGVRRR